MLCFYFPQGKVESDDRSLKISDKKEIALISKIIVCFEVGFFPIYSPNRFSVVQWKAVRLPQFLGFNKMKFSAGLVAYLSSNSSGQGEYSNSYQRRMLR